MFEIKGYFPSVSQDKDCQRESYKYELSEDFIAHRPIAGRHFSKLLVFDEETGEIKHTIIDNIADYLPTNSTFVFNQSQVFPSRLLGKKPSGGKAEAFILDHERRDFDGFYRALIKYRGQKKIDDEINIISAEKIVGKIIIKDRTSEDDSVFLVDIDIFDKNKTFLDYAKLPIPPYIRNGEADSADEVDYQTTFAKIKGSVAAPTAGLHFSNELRKKLIESGFIESFVTLHVGLGTFKPVVVDNILKHHMHTEYFQIDEDNINRVKSSKYRIAVGTTTLRTLQALVNLEKEGKEIRPNHQYATNLFLYPGKTVSACDALVTNFHLPESTLLMLVSTLIGRKRALELYEEAKKNNYRFFSYGDAMLILRNKKEI